MYSSSISRALCSDGMLCIKPLAPSRNETNSSRVNVGAAWAILGICADGGHDQAFPLWPPSAGGLRSKNSRLLDHAREVRDRLFVDGRRLRLARLGPCAWRPRACRGSVQRGP